MLTDAGFTAGRFPGMSIEGLQTMDEQARGGTTADNSKWLKPDGTHVSVPNFDLDRYYWADVDGPKDLGYLNQHVFNGKYSYFGKLLTKRLTKIINLPVFKNTGNAASMATKNIGYGAVCNPQPAMPRCSSTSVSRSGIPDVRDKMVLNVTDGLLCQYDGGPGAERQIHVYRQPDLPGHGRPSPWTWSATTSWRPSGKKWAWRSTRIRGSPSTCAMPSGWDWAWSPRAKSAT